MSIGLITALLGLFRATEFRVAQILVCEYTSGGGPVHARVPIHAHP